MWTSLGCRWTPQQGAAVIESGSRDGVMLDSSLACVLLELSSFFQFLFTYISYGTGESRQQREQPALHRLGESVIVEHSL